MTDIAIIKADREAGTPGPWEADGPVWNKIIWEDGENRVCFMAHSNGRNDGRDEANARRIARVPEMEDTIIAQADQIAALEAENARLREALTPSAETKACYSGEFFFSDTFTDENGDEQPYIVSVPWTSIKEIMAAIRARAALGETQE